MDKDISNHVIVGSVDGDECSLLRCACGKEFKPWDFYLSTSQENPEECPDCGRRMYVKIDIKVFEVQQ